MKALIAGGGIAGVMSALLLAKSGASTRIYERARCPQEFGAGLQLTPNATRILAALGMLETIQRVATKPSAIRIMSGSDDSPLLRMSLEDADRRWGAPYLTLHRADLLKVLVKAAENEPRIAIQYGTEFLAYALRGVSVRVALAASGVEREDEGDLLIGSDGLRSCVRNHLQLAQTDVPEFTGRVAFRATALSRDVEERWLKPEIVLRLGPNAHLVHYPLRSASMINIVAVVSSSWRLGDDSFSWDGAADRQTLDRAFRRWSAPARKLLASAREWRAWPLYRRLPITDFAYGRVALVGDAAHPMEPFLAQGAAQAIEDARALANALNGSTDIPSALALYSRMRVARATKIQLEASQQGRIYHMSGLGALARNSIMRILGSERLLSRYDWIYGA